MDLDTLYKLVAIGGPILGAVLIIIKIFVTNRLHKLEELSDTFVTKQELKETLADKIAPLKEDLAEIKAQLLKVYDLLLRKN